MDTNELDKVEALEKAATAGPWDSCFAPNCFVLGEQTNLKFSPLSWPIAFLPKVNWCPESDNGLIASVCSEEDQKFIAALRNAAPALFADARALAVAKARIAELENSLDWFADENGDGAQREAARLLNP